ncbi:MAG: ribonuclease J [Dehalococcoidia bacterium]|nr:ribonuclease J [Dehalococcoidia bacterium]
MDKKKLRIIPLGGLGEIGKNMMVLEYDDDIIAIDAGLMFPEEDMLGVDLVIPDISYLVENQKKLRGIIVTHGHEDHTGALPYILPRLNVPIYSAPLTQGLISIKLKEHGLLDTAKLISVQPREKLSLGQFKIEFLRMCHSIPDALGLIIRTPVGIVVHSGDFKLDYTPVDSKTTDFTRLAQMGAEGVLLLLSDSTYVEVPGYTPSEQVVGEALRHIMADAPGRVIVTTFASLISRVQQVIDAAARYQRKVFVIGRSMTETVRISQELGYLHSTTGVLSRLEELQRLPPDKIVLLTTGSQGEPTSALVRIANGEHKQVRILPDDTVILSATPIPGNETLINRTIDSLFRQGAQVFYDKVAQVHVHGHGSQEELKLLINLVRPKFLLPIHGEYRHLALHAKLAESLGIPKENSFVMDDGDVLELGPDEGKVTQKLPIGNVYVDGLSDIGHMVLRDRRALAKDGVVIAIMAIDKNTGRLASRPELISRGFVDKTEEEGLMEMGRDLLAKIFDHGLDHVVEGSYIQGKVREALSRLFYEQTKRRPMILPMTVMV